MERSSPPLTRQVLRLLTLLGLPLASGPTLAKLLPRDPDILSYPLLVPEVGPAAEAPDAPLLFSGSPETPGQSGLLYRDRVSGQARLLVYHANGLGRPARLLVLARNPGTSPAVLTTLRRGSASTRQPDPVIGQQTLLRYFASGPLEPREVAPGETTVLFGSESLPEGAVESVMIDLDASAPVEVSVVMLGEGERSDDAALAGLPVLERDPHHQRGTFPGANRSLRVGLSGLPARLVLGGQSDPPLRGIDALTGEAQTLLGNYGVLYSIEVGGAGPSLLAFSPRGGPYQGTLRVSDAGRASQILVGDGVALKEPATPARIWRTRSDTLRLEFVPANGSSLPVALVFYPLASGRGS